MIIATAFRAASSEQATALTTCQGALSKYSRISGECGYSGFVQQAGDCQQGTELVCVRFYGQDANTAFGCPDGFTLRDSVQPQVQADPNPSPNPAPAPNPNPNPGPNPYPYPYPYP